MRLRQQIEQVVKDLRRCAAQNEWDAKDVQVSYAQSIGPKAVGKEQRRMIRILSRVLRESEAHPSRPDPDYRAEIEDAAI